MRTYALVIAALVVCATPLGAQGKGPKKYAVSNDRALIVTKEVLVKQGYEVVFLSVPSAVLVDIDVRLRM